MKYLLLIILLLFITSCGNSSIDNEATGQVKKVEKNTPIICPDYYDVDISLGVLRNGVGSLSTQDLWFYVPDKKDYELLVQAAKTGSLVEFKYNRARFKWCVEETYITEVKLTK